MGLRVKSERGPNTEERGATTKTSPITTPNPCLLLLLDTHLGATFGLPTHRDNPSQTPEHQRKNSPPVNDIEVPYYYPNPRLDELTN